MSSLKSLASQTVIYGLTTILARLLNFALTPLHTARIEQIEYGVLSDLYSIIAFLMVVLTFGMETAYFRFNRDPQHEAKKVFSHTSILTIFTSLSLLVLSYLFIDSIALWLEYPNRPHLVIWTLAIVAMDAMAAVPFAKLRADNRPYRFLLVRLSTIAFMVLLNLFFFLVLPDLAQGSSANSLWSQIYREDWGVEYVFLANLLGNILMMIFFLPEFLSISWSLDKKLMRKLLVYSSPLVIGFLAGIANEKAQYQFMKYLLPDEVNLYSAGIFAAMMKIATFMVLFIQAFRFAAEPFFFSGEGEFKTKMARVMRYFVMVQSLIFLGLVAGTEILKWTHFIDPKYWEGWHIVPILLLANLLLGINFNLNIWYKLDNKTHMGAYISFFGLAFTIILNLILVPRYQYAGAAWATLISYGAMTAYSYYLNQKHAHTPYPLGRIGAYLIASTLGAYLSFYVFDAALIPGLIIFGVYLGLLIIFEAKELKNGLIKR